MTTDRLPTLEEIRFALSKGRGFTAFRHGVEYDIGESESAVCAWVAAEDDEAPSCKRFGDLDPFTGKPEQGTAEAIHAWLSAKPEATDAPE